MNHFSSFDILSSLEIKETEEDIKLAIEIVCDQLTDSLAQELMAKFGYATAEIGAKPVNSTNNKRKADWEIQLEVRSI